MSYSSADTALLIVDPFNDFISEGGKVFGMIKEVAERHHAIANMRTILEAARDAGIRIFFVPHRRWRTGDYSTWRHPNPSQLLVSNLQLFPADGWGGQWHPDFVPRDGDVVVGEHWAQSGFANTDLDAQLKQHRIEKLVLVGMLANTCIESTARAGMEIGYHVTLVTDATAAFSSENLHAAHAINGPTYAHAILGTQELLKAFAAERRQSRGISAEVA